MEKISLKERFSYGLGDLACNLMFQRITAYLMFFYTDVAGIGLGAISLIMLVARVVDAVTDPMMGVIIDKTHTLSLIHIWRKTCDDRRCDRLQP